MEFFAFFRSLTDFVRNAAKSFAINASGALSDISEVVGDVTHVPVM